MIKQMNCPNCGSEHTAIEKRPGGWFHCQDCHYSWQPSPVRFGFDAPTRKQTLFETITASPEVLAPNFVVEVIAEYLTAKFVTGYRSTIIPGKIWEHEAEATAATVTRLKEVCDEVSKDS